MSDDCLSDEQWKLILTFLKLQNDIYVGREDKSRRFIEAVLWMLSSDVQWRLLPKEKGMWNSVYKRFVRWHKRNLWERMYHHFATHPEMEDVRRVLQKHLEKAH